jgi:hypothetical protein
MQKSAMCTKLNKQFASGFAVGSLFPFFCEVSFSLYGKSFFLPVCGQMPLKTC